MKKSIVKYYSKLQVKNIEQNILNNSGISDGGNIYLMCIFPYGLGEYAGLLILRILLLY